ncbi:hypothetical protein B296_00034305 [Ensete ventricosum]|uniref:Uncharacterized protein n=1 Tax=Ensete ventricosum TaxID=4639 RepID=A0A426ZWD6_ENSVE|nr:hypothetical protein B296_00034305 [Ensete ventricosum]
MGSRMSMVSRKNATIINFAQRNAQSLVLVSFSCTVSEFQNTHHSQCISPWEVVRARFREKMQCISPCDFAESL